MFAFPEGGSRWKAAALLFTLLVVTYWPALKSGFMIDDSFLILNNPRLQSWSTASVVQDFTSSVYPDGGSTYYRPVQALFLRAQYSLWGLRPWPYHAVTLLLQFANALMLAMLVALLGFPAATSFIVATLFAVHPIIVMEMMASSEITVISLFWILLSLLLLARPGWKAYLGGFLAYLAAVFTKESGVVVPVLVGLLFFAMRRPAWAYWRIAPLLLVWPLYLLLRSASVGPITGITAPSTFQFVTQAFPKVLFLYITRWLVPWGLQSWPPICRLSHVWPLYLGALIALGFFALRHKSRWVGFCFGWVVVMLLPYIPALMITGTMLDHWIYASSFGLLLPVALFLQSRRFLHLVLLTLWALASSFYLQARGSEEKNFRWTMRFVQPTHVEYRLAILLLNSGRAAEALPHFEALVRDVPNEVGYQNGLALSYWWTGKKKEARELLQKIVKEHPDYTPAVNNLQRINRGSL